MHTDDTGSPRWRLGASSASYLQPLALVALTILLLAGLVAPAALASPLLEPTPVEPAGARRFEARVLTKVQPGDAREVQEVLGRIIDRQGRGVEGVTVRVAWDGGQFQTSSSGGGNFKFTLTRGRFRIDLIGLSAETAPVDLDGKTDVSVEFVERAAAATAPTAPAAGATTTTATRTPTRTVTATPTPAAPRTPLPAVGTPIAISISPSQSQPTATATPLSGLPGPSALGLGNVSLGLQVNPADLARPFLLGIMLAAALAVLGLILVALRR